MKVCVKNFDVFRKINRFDLDPFQTLYSFNVCDLILNDKNFVVIGKIKILGKNKPLSATIFEFEKKGEALKPRRVKIENVQEVGSDLEIEFTDDSYLNRMTLVINRADHELKEKINGLQHYV